eukprot:GHVL01023579.1.p1 GENE.GHVL01023579.1~~GHVL01023579.1.p1  ORF type:complete len:625 (-),score=51.34 GHVL01023579.1:123-1997(-)
MRIYSKVVNHPFADSLAQSIFQTGIVPSDTDYRIYRDYGMLKGLDLAVTENGYVYHTVLDAVGIIPSGTLQHYGDTVLNMLEAFDNNPMLLYEQKAIEDAIYFDINVSTFVTIFACILGFYSILFRPFLKNKPISSTEVILAKLDASPLFAISVGFAFFCGILGAFVLPLIIAGFLIVTGNSMLWYSHIDVLAVTFIIPSFFAFSRFRNSLFDALVKNVHQTISKKMDSCQIDSKPCLKKFLNESQLRWQILFWIFILILSYVFSMRGITPFCWFWIVALSFSKMNTMIEKTLFHQLITFLPSLMTVLALRKLLAVMIPVSGRMGAISASDFVIGGICALGGAILAPNLPLLTALPNNKKNMTLLVMLLWIFVVLSFIFVYKHGYTPTKPKRLRIGESRITSYYENGTEIEETGLQLNCVDHSCWNKLKPEKILKHLNTNSAYSGGCGIQKLANHVFCRYPHFYPIAGLAKSVIWQPIKTSVFLDQVKPSVKLLEITPQKCEEKNCVEALFLFTGPKRLSLKFSSIQDVFAGWSLGQTTLVFRKECNCHFIQIIDSGGWISFRLRIKFQFPVNLKKFKIVWEIISFDSTKETETIKSVIDYLPDWSTVDERWIADMILAETAIL